MAQDDDSSPAVSEEEQRKRALALTEDIAKRYDGDRLSKMIVEGAGSGDKLDLATQLEMERKIGGRFSDVRVFRGPFAEAVTKAHKADAVTVANTGMILVREGPRGNPKTALGKALLAHELTHVRQAQSGLHFALEGGASGHGGHEREAEKVEQKVHDEASGKGGKGKGGGGMKKEDLERIVIEKVIEIMEEEDRIHIMRTNLG
jgi:hypothetical protein